jgi:putative hydrolase of the HAD superfamily
MNLSFDLWGTLIKSNPKFKEHQLKIASQMFDMSIEQIDLHYRQTKKMCDTIVEKYCVQFDRLQLLSDIFDTADFDKIDKYIEISNNLFLEYPPIIINDISDIVENHHVFITSNTVMIYGDVLEKIVNNYFNISSYNTVFSDEIHVSKPHREIFSEILFGFDYHIGDNPITDGSCEKYGIKFLLLNEHNNENLKIFRK